MTKFKKLPKYFFPILLIIFFVGLVVFKNSKPEPLPKQININSDPQYLIVNESDLLKDKVEWSAPENKWEESIKPKVEKRLDEIRDNLGQGNKDRKLGWSIIVAYMDYPLDEPSTHSPYVVMVKRLMEISEDLDFPVFIPLNGFQWWNQLPELWNWWDSGPDQIEGCIREQYKEIDGHEKDGKPIPKCKFPELRDPAYRAHFAKAYNPDNKWNVEWINWNTPMRQAWRDWGGGPFQIAPLPNLVDIGRTKLSYRSVQNARLKMIAGTLVQYLGRWESQSKLDLFAGVSIGTEVSLHAASTSIEKFDITGYRAVQDIYCDKNHPACGEHANWSQQKMRQGRQEVVYRYLSELGKIVHDQGIPKQRIYTHVWSENLPPDNQFVNYFITAVNPYSRPGLSLYSYSDRPLELPPFIEGLKKFGFPTWASPEFNLPFHTEWNGVLNKSFDNNLDQAKIVDIYNWNIVKNTPAVPVIQEFLREQPKAEECQISEILSKEIDNLENPNVLKWSYLNPRDNSQTQYLVLSKNKIPRFDSKDFNLIKIATDSTSFNLEKINLVPGQYYWFIKRVGCDEKKWTTSAPSVFFTGNVITRKLEQWKEYLSETLHKLKK